VKKDERVMHILYQIPGHMSAGPLGSPEIERRRALLQEWASDGVTMEVADSPGGPLSIESHAEEVLCVPPMMAAVSRRDRAADAVIIGCFGDPGLAALREILECPVVGPFEASFHMGAQLGARVGIVTILDSVTPMLDHIVHGMGQSLRYAGTAAIGVPVLELGKDPGAVTERVVQAGAELIRHRNADVLLLGCMSLAFLGIAERTAPALGIPVINPAKCALKTAEALLAQGLLQSRRTYARPRKGSSCDSTHTMTRPDGKSPQDVQDRLIFGQAGLS
jgi:allantoin racemase